MNELQHDLETWIYNWVSVYNSNLGTVPCPFAKQAYVDNKILIHELKHTDTKLSMKNYIASELEKYTYQWPDGIEVVALGFNPELLDSKKLGNTVQRCNNTFLRYRGYVALEDHPEDPEIVAGESMNQGKWALVLLQAADKLNKASAILHKQGYYKNWSQNDLDNVVNWRN